MFEAAKVPGNQSPKIPEESQKPYSAACARGGVPACRYRYDAVNDDAVILAYAMVVVVILNDGAGALFGAWGVVVAEAETAVIGNNLIEQVQVKAADCDGYSVIEIAYNEPLVGSFDLVQTHLISE